MTTEIRSILNCLVLGFEGDLRSAGVDTATHDDWLRRLVRLQLESLAINGHQPRKLYDPVKTTVTAESEVADSSFVLAEISQPDPVMFFYLGLARAQGKTLLTLRRFDAVGTEAIGRQADFALDYEDTVAGREDLAKQLRNNLESILRADALDHGLLLGRQASIEIDWRSLSPAQQNNLCLDILLREGFEELRWTEDCRELDLIALRPQEDGDRELFLIAMGNGLTDAPTAECCVSDFALQLDDIRRLAAQGRLAASGGRIDINLLFIWSVEAAQADDFGVDTALLKVTGTRLATVARNAGLQVRLRAGAWNRARLEGMIRRYPMVLRQYFSGEPGEDFEHRKTVEQLYREVSQLAHRAVLASGDLEKKYGLDPGFEWQKRAYTVTHSIGNAIFPVETYLDFIHELFEEAKTDEGLMLTTKARTSLDKAKVHIAKFKNIARLKKPSLSVVDILPRLEISLDAADAAGIRVDRYFGEHPQVNADADLFDELADELVANSISWLQEAEEQNIQITVKPALPDDLTPFLAAALESPEDGYLWIRFQDSGPGVASDLKEQIFELFFSTNPSGMGFGLAIVRKNLRDFGGDIVETGMPGMGACFDIFLPIAPP